MVVFLVQFSLRNPKIITMFHLTVILAFTTFFATCTTSNNNNNNDNRTRGDSTGKPVETKPPNADFKPAFAGQTRIAGVKTTTPYEGKMIASGLSSPWGIVTLPDGRFLITEKGGSMRIVSTAGKISDPITGLPAVNAS